MKDWAWRVLLIGIWAIITFGNLFVFWRYEMPWYGLAVGFMFFYLFAGALFWAIVKDMILWSKSWRMLIAWLPGLVSERVRAWVMWEK